MAVPTSITELSTTAGSNSPAGSEAIGTNADNYLRAIQSILKTVISQGSDITSASTITPGDGNYFIVTGSTGPISTIASTNSWNGREIVLKFSSTPTLTHSVSLILPGAANITAAAGDVMSFAQESSGVWRCTGYVPAVGLVKLDVDQSWTGAQRGTPTTDNDGSFDLSAANNFTCTPTGNVTLTFTNHTSGQSGFILFDNTGAYTGHSLAATTKADSSFLAVLNASGVFLISYYDNGTNAYVATTKALS